MENSEIIRSRAYTRAGFVGNPSDGYNGKTISFTFDNFYAETVMYEAPYIELLPNRRDRSIYSSFDDLEQSVLECGYYGGIRLLQAALRRFREYCCSRDIELGGKGFAMRYFSNIPHRVGLAGSSAIITACFRGLMKFYEVEIPKPDLANIILSVESEELGIGAGLQDRVAQVYQGLTYMDFDKEKMAARGYGDYVALDPALLPNIYIAYKLKLSEGSEVFHNNIRARYEAGEKLVVNAMETWATLAEQARDALVEGRKEEIGKLINANFDLRRSIYKIHPDNIQMVEAARSVGASAKFSGSGGAIVGTYADNSMFAELKKILEPLSIAVLKPNVI
jgi:glucuronokinase